MKKVVFKSGRIWFGEKDEERWSFSNVDCRRTEEAVKRVKLEAPIYETTLLLSMISDLHYLIYTCPTTKLACEQLAQIRSAVRKAK